MTERRYVTCGERLRVTTIAAGVAGWLLAVSGPVISAAPPDSRDDVAAVIATLLDGARSRDAAAVERAVCLAAKIERQRARRRSLGLLDGEAEVRFADEFRAKYLAAVYEWYAEITRQGASLESVDLDRVPAGSESGPADEPVSLGIVGLRFGSGGDTVDLVIARGAGTWCVDPVVLP